MINADIISLIDLTLLKENNCVTEVRTFCKQALTPLGPVAAVCIYPEFIDTAKKALEGTSIPVATVANFPQGHDTLDVTLHNIKKSIERGANEIDVVMPYAQLIAGQQDYVGDFLLSCKEAAQGVLLKVIIESGALTPHLIRQATSIVAAIGADFVKTSTGKIEKGACLTDVEIILQTLSSIHDAPGIKISGGLRTPAQAEDYLRLIAEYMGKEWINSQHVRLGASQLLHRLL